MNEPIFDWLLVIIGGCGAVWALTPPLFTLLGLAGVKNTPVEDPALAATGTEDADYEARAIELAALGFEPVGLVTETMYFQGIEWWKQFFVRIWANKDRTCYVSLYRLHPAEALRIALRTMTTEEGLVCAASPGAGVTDEQNNYLRREYPFGTPIQELLALHQRDVEGFSLARDVKTISGSLDEITKVEEAHERRLLKGIWQGNAALAPAQMFVGPAFVIFLVLPQPLNLGSLGLALCAGLVVYGAFRLAVSHFFAHEVTTTNPPAPETR